MKIIELSFENGEKWQIPLEFVAKHRAKYYESRGEKDFDLDEEIKYIMDDDYEGEDWLKNNMDFKDFEDVLKIIPNNNPKTKDWCNADSEIIEKDTA